MKCVCAVAYAFMSVRNITMYVDAVCAKIHQYMLRCVHIPRHVLYCAYLCMHMCISPHSPHLNRTLNLTPIQSRHPQSVSTLHFMDVNMQTCTSLLKTTFPFHTCQQRCFSSRTALVCNLSNRAASNSCKQMKNTIKCTLPLTW